MTTTFTACPGSGDPHPLGERPWTAADGTTYCNAGCPVETAVAAAAAAYHARQGDGYQPPANPAAEATGARIRAEDGTEPF